jgi:SNF2 family DNA or RNA helicase
MLGSAAGFAKLLDPDGSAQGSNLTSIAQAIRPFFLRRTKSQVLAELPEKTEQTIFVELPPKQRKAYDQLGDYYRKLLLGADVAEADANHAGSKLDVLTALLRLRQCACHEGLIDSARAEAPSAKLDELVERLGEIAQEGNKALVFSQFTKFLALVRARLEAAGIPYEYLDGRTRDRKAKVERFQSDPALPAFLISLKAGGTGLNLTAADYVFLLDPWWNPAVESQAIDRAHRIGRTRPVVAYRIVAKKTIEERVLELQATKRELVSTLFDERSGSIANLSRDELERLLS